MIRPRGSRIRELIRSRPIGRGQPGLDDGLASTADKRDIIRSWGIGESELVDCQDACRVVGGKDCEFGGDERCWSEDCGEEEEAHGFGKV